MTPFRRRPRAQAGSASIELALLLPVLMILMMAPFFIAQVFRYYTVVQKAGQDAARYLSTISEQEMRDPGLAAAAADLAARIARAEIDEIKDGPARPAIEVYCGGTRQCSGVRDDPLPATVRVYVEVSIADEFLFFVDTGRYGWKVMSDVEVAYVGQ